MPVVIHFARFEEPFLRALHERHGAGPFPLDLVCTHAIACRLLPELPRRTLRALAGYFGAAVPPLRRSADHVAATAFVWRHLVALLAEREGVVGLDELHEWLARPARRSPRRFPLPRERRLELPDRPGVYRLLRAGGAVLYVGKAASLRQRVSGHFHARGGERALEMLTQARDVSCTETETALEAALLEADEIKRLAPPFNIALAAAGRAVWFATADLRRSAGETGPGAHRGSARLAGAHRGARRRCAPFSPSAEPASLALRARAVGVEPAYAPGPSVSPPGSLVSSGARCGRDPARPPPARRAAVGPSTATVGRAPELDDAAAEEPQPETPRRPAWDAERVRQALEETVAPRRARGAARRAGSSGSASARSRGRSRGRRGAGCW